MIAGNSKGRICDVSFNADTDGVLKETKMGRDGIMGVTFLEREEGEDCLASCMRMTMVKTLY